MAINLNISLILESDNVNYNRYTGVHYTFMVHSILLQ